MISWMQKNNKFTVVIMWVAVGSFILSTAVIGAQAGLKSNVIGKVGEVELTKNKFSMEYDQLFSRYNEMMQGRFDKEQAKKMGLQDQVIRNMAAQAKILNLAKEFGIIVTEEETATKLASFPLFQERGTFNRKNYDTYIQNHGLTKKTFENNIKDQLIIEKTFKLLNNESLEKEYEAFKVAFEVADKIKYTLLTHKDVDVEITDEKLKAFWEPRKDQYKTAKQYTLDIQWTETKDTEVTEKEIKDYYNENRFQYKSSNGKISSFEDVKLWVTEATKVAKSKKSALKRYVQFKKGALAKDETLTLDINDPKLSKALWDEIQNGSINDFIKAKVVDNRYASVKVINIVNPVTKAFNAVKEEITSIYRIESEKEALAKLSEEKLSKIDNIDTNVSTFITLDNQEAQKIGLNQQETGIFVSKLFTSEQEKGIIPIGSKVLVYKIIEQKLISLENNSTNILHDNVTQVKNQSFQAELMKILDNKYPTKLY